MKRNGKTYTPEQVAAKQDKAVRFLRDVAGDDDKADEIEALSLEEYAEREKLHMNPSLFSAPVEVTISPSGGEYVMRAERIVGGKRYFM